MRVVNLGSVSNHTSQDTRSSYIILDVSATGHTVERRLVEYDNQMAIDHVRAVNHPSADFIIGHLAGDFTANWSNWKGFTSDDGSRRGVT